jgi:hypothetical protein
LPKGNGNEEKQNYTELLNFQRALTIGELNGSRAIRLPRNSADTNTKVRDVRGIPDTPAFP